MWDWAIWIGLAVGAALGIAAAARLGVAVLRFFRDLKRTRRRLFRELDDLAAAAEALGTRAAGLDQGSERLTRSLEQLAVSRRRLAVLQSALDEADPGVTWLAALARRR